MKRMKREPIIHKPGTKEIFLCLSGAVEWCKILSKTYQEKPYRQFLDWLIDRHFFESDNRILINKISDEFQKPPSLVTRWINEIYSDIFELNYESPELFQKGGIPVSLYFSHYDNGASINLSVPSLPREFEIVRCYFVKAKMDIDFFWVDKIEHSYGECSVITIWLEGGFPNKYRKTLFEKAVFYERIRPWDIRRHYEFEVDDQLKRLYRE